MASKIRLGLLLGCLAISLVSGAALSAEPAATAEAQRAELATRFQAGLDAICKKYELPGMTAAYVLPEGEVVAFASGLADREAGTKMTPRTRMPSGSVGKTFVAATVVGLAQDGKLGLDDKIEKWLGREPWFEDLPAAHDITIRHLLMHRGGLADHVNDPRFAAKIRQLAAGKDAQSDFYFQPPELVEFILKRKPLSPAGQKYAYTDTGYILLGMIVERAGGASYYEQLRRRFLEPLALALTEPADKRDIPGVAAGYLSPTNPLGLPEKTTTGDGKLRFHPANEWTGGGLVSNPADLVRWAKTLYEGRALEKPYLAELVATDPADKDRPSRYGLGVFVNDSPLGTSYGHGGWYPGYLTRVNYYPAQRVAVAFQVNTDTRSDMLGDLAALVEDVLETVGKAP